MIHGTGFPALRDRYVGGVCSVKLCGCIEVSGAHAHTHITRGIAIARVEASRGRNSVLLLAVLLAVLVAVIIVVAVVPRVLNSEEGLSVILHPPKEPEPHRRPHENLQIFVPLLDLGDFEAAVRLRAARNKRGEKFAR